MIHFDILCQNLQEKKNFLTADSREVKEGSIFVILPLSASSHQGKKFPPINYLKNALEQGASAIVLEEEMYNFYQKETSFADTSLFCIVEDSRKSLGILANAYYDTANLPFPVIAITGTNGKTTSAYLLEHLYKSCGKKVAMLGTVSYHWGDHFEDAPLTTPPCLRLHKALHDMKEAKVDVLIMEVSSHAIDQDRIAGIAFSGALFTNLTQDHLDYHENMENYFEAKAKLFKSLPLKDKAMSVFADDEYGKRLLAQNEQIEGYILHEKDKGTCSCVESSNPLLHGQLLQNSPAGLVIEQRYKKTTWKLTSHLVGEHNACNILGVECLALQLGFSIEDMQHLATFNGVPGRLERIRSKNPTKELENAPSFFVDYAHTPDALIKAQHALREAGFNRVITLFGCGGDRDRTKRPLMGQAVAEASDIVILTSDNPRTEEPERILDDIMPGLALAKEVHRVVDRKEALTLAFSIAKEGDAVLVAGKGHETYQIIGTTKSHFSDQEILQELLDN